jgi:uncharacterized protein (TIGR01244 family)
MPDRIKINDDIMVGAQPSEAELKAMADDGFKSVISLRTDDEPMQRLSPDEEGDKAREFGLEYTCIPVSMDQADHALVDRFRQQLDDAPKPVYVHCRMGKRAGAFVMMDQAVKNDLTGQQTLEKAEEMGFQCDEESLEKFVRTYVDSRES